MRTKSRDTNAHEVLRHHTRATGRNRDVRAHSPVRRAYRSSTFMVWSVPEASKAMIPVAPE
jgi:hypothetical protein